MRGRLNKCLILGGVLMFILSFPLHFLFDWLKGEPSWIGFFVPVSESVWEHLKLLFYPGLIIGFAEYFCVRKNYKNFLQAKVIGVLSGMAGIVVSFYTYSGILGKDFLIADILTYVFGVAVCQYVTGIILKRGSFGTLRDKRKAVFLILIMGILFAVFTFNPPSLNIFISPV